MAIVLTAILLSLCSVPHSFSLYLRWHHAYLFLVPNNNNNNNALINS